MVNWHLLGLFIAMETLLCLTPGPAVLLILSQGLSGGLRRSLWSSFGVLLANIVYFALSATSIGAVLIASGDLFFAIRWVGAAYLIWLGIGALRGTSPHFSVSADPTRHPRRFALLRHGFVVQISNPKAILFFAALLPQFVDPTLPAPLQLLLLGGSSVAIEFTVLSSYGLLAGRASVVATRPRFAAMTNRLSGGALIAAGCGLALLKRG